MKRIPEALACWMWRGRSGKFRGVAEPAAEDSNMTVEQFKDAMSKLPLEAVWVA